MDRTTLKGWFDAQLLLTLGLGFGTLATLFFEWRYWPLLAIAAALSGVVTAILAYQVRDLLPKGQPTVLHAHWMDQDMGKAGINPATGLIMASSTRDIAGNPWGVDLSKEAVRRNIH
jgi:hypothetical protein